MDINRISACTYPMREHPFDYALEVLADAGLHRADLWGRSPHLPADPTREDLAAIKAASERTGVAIANLGTYPGGEFSSDDDDERMAALQLMKRTIDAAAELGCLSIRVSPGAGEDPAIIDTIVPYMSQSAQYAEAAGVRLGFENHAGGIASDPGQCLRLCEAVGSRWFGVLYEPCNLLHAGVDYRRAFDMLADWIVHVHVKDGVHTDDGFKRVHLGDGDVDPRWIVDALEGIGYRGDYALEYEITALEPIETALRKWVEAFVQL
ncbi:MAG: sugar phosphate isomerase/epimerase [candidate division WS1 bacterium]|jgi:sugar phosphate isomerase/epimerase|nr:sugar phosphate isomerase/epimerase [candidate division WS1 bacterium]